MDAVAPIPQTADQATIGKVITEAQRMLEQAGIESAGQEAYWIVEHGLRLPAHHNLSQIETDYCLAPSCRL